VKVESIIGIPQPVTVYAWDNDGDFEYDFNINLQPHALVTIQHQIVIQGDHDEAGWMVVAHLGRHDGLEFDRNDAMTYDNLFAVVAGSGHSLLGG